MADFDNEMAADLFTLVDEDGVEQTFELYDEYEDEDGTLYYALVPYYDDPQASLETDAELVILRLDEGDDGEDVLSTIDDDDEYERIGEIFMERLDAMYGE